MGMTPTTLSEITIDHSLRTGAFPLHYSGAYISTLIIIFVGNNIIIFYSVQNPRPVNGWQKAELSILLNPYGPSGNVHQAVKANLFQVNHLKDDQSIVEKEMSPTDHSEIGEKLPEALHTVDPE